MTTNNQLSELIRDGLFFNFCTLFSVEKGFKEHFKEKREVKFMVGNYIVEYDRHHVCFFYKAQGIYF